MLFVVAYGPAKQYVSKLEKSKCDYFAGAIMSLPYLTYGGIHNNIEKTIAKRTLFWEFIYKSTVKMAN